MTEAFKLWCRNIILVFLFAFPFLFLLVRNGFLPRELLEGITVALAFLVICVTLSVKILLFVLIIVVFRMVYSGGVGIGLYDVAAVSLLIYLSGFSLDRGRAGKAIVYLIFVEFSFGMLDFYMGRVVDYNRYSGVFPGSLHYGFSSIGLAVALYFMDLRYKGFLYVLLLMSTVLSGSRSSFIIVSFFSFIYFVRVYGAAIVAIIVAAFVTLVFDRLSSVRALNYVEHSDMSRFNGYIAWFERLSPEVILFGTGRYFLGSVGAVNNMSATIVTESSVLAFLEGYGFLIGSIFLLAPLFFFYKKLCFLDFLIVSGAIFFAAGLGPFFETPSILFVNTVLIISAVSIYSTRMKVNRVC